MSEGLDRFAAQQHHRADFFGPASRASRGQKKPDYKTDDWVISRLRPAKTLDAHKTGRVKYSDISFHRLVPICCNATVSRIQGLEAGGVFSPFVSIFMQGPMLAWGQCKVR